MVMTCREGEGGRGALEAAGAEVLSMPYCATDVDLVAVLDQLGQLEINEVLVETGATLSGAFLQAGLIDELIIYMAPLLMGDNARGLFRLPGLEQMQDRIELNITDVRTVGRDLRLTAGIEAKQNRGG